MPDTSSQRWRIFRYHCSPRTGAPEHGSLTMLGAGTTQGQAQALLRWHREQRPYCEAFDIPYHYLIVKPGVWQGIGDRNIAQLRGL